MNYLLCAYGLEFAMSINPFTLIISYFFLGLIGVIVSIISEKTVVSFICYNLIVIPSGLVLSIALQEYGGIDTIIVRQALLYTVIITGVMITLGVIFPKAFERLGMALFIASVGLAIASIIMIIYNIEWVVISWISAIVYSLYIGYDIHMSQKLKRTTDNAVDCAIDIYLDIFGIFINILGILGKSNEKNNIINKNRSE